MSTLQMKSLSRYMYIVHIRYIISLNIKSASESCLIPISCTEFLRVFQPSIACLDDVNVSQPVAQLVERLRGKVTLCHGASRLQHIR